MNRVQTSFYGYLVRRLRLLWLTLLVAGCFQQLAPAQCANPVACENQLTGNTGWDPGTDDTTIQGFATDISVDVGQTVYFKINTNAKAYTINVYRIGYYKGAGARQVATVTPSVSLPQTQPACLTDSTTNLVDCGNWEVSASWTVPTTAVSGIYFANITRTDTGGTSQIFWVVRNDASHSDILFQTSDQTWEAYNPYGGHSLYGAAGTWDYFDRAFKVSYNRPFNTRAFEAATFVYNAEYPMVGWLEENGYDVSYFTDVDAVRNASLITNHKLYLSVGHDEYVSGERRTNIEAARDAGVNLAFFSGNEVFWKTRWENSIDGTSTPYRTMVCYKETFYQSGTGTYQQDPDDPPTWTGTWADPRFSPPADGGLPQNALTGTLFKVNGPGSDNTNLSIQVTGADGQMRFWRNTSIATIGSGPPATLPAGTLGYEWDADIDNGFRPAGLVPLSTSTYTLTTDYLQDYGVIYGAGTATHHLTLYRAPSGALVFGGGTVQWAWGLDSDHDGSANPAPDVRMQQATVNLFADMGIQPTTLQSGLVRATKSTDTTPPVAIITSPASGSTVTYGSAVTITGTASDTGGGVVGAVEVSVDGGNSWHPATGRGQWSYTWSPWALNGTATVEARAIDDSENIQTTPASVSFTVGNEPSCPCSIWSSSATPGTPSASDPSSVELGVKFRSDVAGYVTAVRFYKGTGNTGTHVGHLWTNGGTMLSSVTFTNETASGWQQANFSSPVAIRANTSYIVSYYAPNGGYADDEPYFSSNGVNSPPLHALQDGVDGADGVYVYATGGGYPTTTSNAGNYWVDLVFVPSTQWSISGTISGVTGATVTLSGPINATTTTDSSGNYSFNSVLNGTYTVTPSANGYTFNPTSQQVTVSGASVSAINFAASAAQTYTLSGTISGGSGETVTLSGTESATTTANSSGNYSFTVVSGSYTVTPTEAGYGFSPASQTVTVNGANVSGVNFTAMPVFSIWTSSSVPSDPSASDANAVELGLKFTSDVPGTVTAVRFYKGSSNTGTHVGHLWTSSGTQLASVSFSNETASGWQQASFSPPVSIAANTTYIISYYAPNGGYAADQGFFATSGVDNPPLHALSNSVADGNGVYIYGAGGGFPTETYNSTNYWVDLVFTPAGAYSISGTISGTGGETVTLSGASSATVNADSSGNYSFTGLANGNYTVTPTESGYTFSPTNAAVTINGSNVTGVNFTATAATYSISGTISGTGGETVTLRGASSATVNADSSGNYSFTGLANGNYTVTPSKSGYTFNPANAALTINGANIIGVNFTATATTTGSFSISGTISGIGGETVTLSGASSATINADSSGNYSFTGLGNGNYTITPSESGYTFSPANAAVTINGANITGVNFTAKVALSVDAKVSVDHGTASSSVTTGAFSTTAANELMLAFISTDANKANMTVTGVSGAGLTWVLVVRTNTQFGTAEIWRAFAASTLSNVTVKATLSQSVASSMTVVSFKGVDTSGSNGSGAIGATGTANAASGAPTASVVTTRNYSWVFGVGSDWDNAIARTPGSGQSLVHQYLAPVGDTYWVQMENALTPTSGTTVTMNDTAPTADRYNLSICEVRAAP